MAGHWPSSFIACLWTETEFHSQKRRVPRNFLDNFRNDFPKLSISYLSKFSGLQAAWEHLQNDQYVIGVAIGTLAITLNIHTKSHTVRGRPTLKLVERFGNGSVRELYERSI